MSFNTMEECKASYQRYLKLCAIKVGDTIDTVNGKCVVNKIEVDGCNFFIFRCGKFNKTVYEKAVVFS